MSWNGKYWEFVKYSIGVFIFGFFWISCINYFWSRSSWFSRLNTISNLYIFFFSPLYIFFMSWNGKYLGSVEPNIGGLFFGFLWFSCINYFSSRSSWFSRLKTISNLFVFCFLSTLYFFHDLEWQLERVRKILHWDLIFWILLV